MRSACLVVLGLASLAGAAEAPKPADQAPPVVNQVPAAPIPAQRRDFPLPPAPNSELQIGPRPDFVIIGPRGEVARMDQPPDPNRDGTFGPRRGPWLLEAFGWQVYDGTGPFVLDRDGLKDANSVLLKGVRIPDTDLLVRQTKSEGAGANHGFVGGGVLVGVQPAQNPVVPKSPFAPAFRPYELPANPQPPAPPKPSVSNQPLPGTARNYDVQQSVPVLSLPIQLPSQNVVSAPGAAWSSDAKLEQRVIAVPAPVLNRPGDEQPTTILIPRR